MCSIQTITKADIADDSAINGFFPAPALRSILSGVFAEVGIWDSPRCHRILVCYGNKTIMSSFPDLEFGLLFLTNPQLYLMIHPERMLFDTAFYWWEGWNVRFDIRCRFWDKRYWKLLRDVAVEGLHIISNKFVSCFCNSIMFGLPVIEHSSNFVHVFTLLIQFEIFDFSFY